MNLTFRLGRYELTDPPTELSPAWTRRGVKAFTIDSAEAWAFVEHADERTSERLHTLYQEAYDAMKASWAVDADYDVPMPSGEALRPYQKAGVAYAMEREYTLIADVPRIGKSAQALGVANKMGAKRVIICCPANAKPQWRDYCHRWLVNRDLKIQVVTGQNDAIAGDVLIVNWEILSYYGGLSCDLCVADESRAIKNERSQRSRAFFAIPAKKTLFLDGTPINTRPIDLWPIVRAADRLGLGRNRSDFAKRYCDGKFVDGVWDESGASNMEELQRRMRAAFMIRREKRDVVTEINSSRQTIWLPYDPVQGLIDAEINALTSGDTRTLEEILVARMDGETGNDDAVMDARQALALAKLPDVIEYTNRLLTSVDKVVVFAYHRAVTGALAEAFGGCALVRGGLTPKQRQEAIDRFQNDPECRVFVGNITACNSAISLAAADDVVYAELSWIPTEMAQSEERTWLPGKENPLTMHWLMFENSADAAMYHVLQVRLDALSKALDRGEIL